MKGPVVVGVDGSPDAARAVRWAAEQARRHGTELVALLAWSFLDQHHEVPGTPFDGGYDAEVAQRALQEYLRQALGEGAGGVVERVVCDLPVDALVDASETAGLVVVGRRGRGGFAGLRLGSVSERLLARSRGPVAVVGGDEGADDGPVAVAVDGSTTSADALRWALGEARARQVPLVVVHVWSEPWLAERLYEPDAPVFDRLQQAAEDVVETLLREVDTTGLEVRREVLRGGAAARIVETAGDAALLVVGSRGLGAVAGALFGSVSRQVVHHAPCTVVVVPPVV